MTNKILGVICCLMLVFGVIFITNDYYFRRPVKYVAAANINNVSKSYNLVSPGINFPTKNKDSAGIDINAQSALLIDADTMYPLFAQNETEKVPIASLTKIAGALVVLEDYSDNLNDIVTVPVQATGVTGDKIGLRAGEKISVKDLVNGLLIMSGNDAAHTLSDYFGGREEFVSEMNAKVAKIGLVNTKFFDPAGLDDEGYSSARDLAILTNYALKNKQFAEIVKTPQTSISSENGNITHLLKNSNRLLLSGDNSFLPEAIGIKTGFTTPAGHVMISAAKKDNHTLICVILHTDEHSITASAKESKKLLQWGLSNWSWQKTNL